MKINVFSLLCIFYIFTLSNCDNNVNSDDGHEIAPHEIAPIESWNYSSVAFIARITNNSAEWSLCIMDSSGNNMHKIVEMTTTCSSPIRSNSGTKLLFTTYTSDYYYELYSVNTDGSELTLIDRGYLTGAAWSPDDKYIAYVKYSDAYWNSCDMILYDTSNKTSKVLNVTGKEKHSPRFSPDGKQIAYCATVPSDTLFIGSHRNHHIYKVDITGENNQLIINEASYPQWSPSGDKILYLSSGIDGSSQIFAANADGSNRKQLTSSVSPIWFDTGFPRDGNEDPHWTPDGQKIVYVSWENQRPEIFIMNADGSHKKRLTTAELRDENPEITPDGEYILFSSRRSDMINNGICIMKLDGSNRRVLYKEGGIYPIACK